MSARKLHVSADLALPQDVVTSTLIVYGGKGMGKTNFGSVLVEELAATGLRFSVLDPMGVWWGLRHSEDGKGPGIEVLILGGIHGDIPIEPTGGAVVADLVVDEDANVVIDVSRRPDGTMWAIAERVRFVRDYCKRLYQRQGERRRPLLQAIDEAARFIPQIIRKDDSDVAACMGAIAVLVEEGRNVGVGVALITQRSARLNKDVAELADCMIAFRTVGPNSRRAVLDWLGEHVEKDRVKTFDEQIRALPRGSALVVSPGWLEYEGIVRMRMRHTFDSSATPKSGQERRASGPGAKPDLAKYQQRMAATIEKAKAEDPKVLRQRVATLERELAAKGTPPAKVQTSAVNGTNAAAMRQVQAETRQVQAHADKLTQALERLMKFIVEINAQDFFKAGGEAIDQAAIQKAIDGAAQQAVKLIEANLAARRKGLEKWRRQGEQALDEIRRLIKQDVKVTVSVKHNEAFTVRPAPARPAATRDVVPTEGLTRPQQRILNALRWLESIGVGAGDKTQVAMLADQSPTSSSYANNVSALRTAGLVDYPQPAAVGLTDAGRALADPGEVPSTSAELHELLYRRLPRPQVAILTVVIAVHPEEITKAELAERAGASATSSSYANNLSALRSLKLIDYTPNRGIIARPVLFLEGART